jgi:hypothetical protein
MFLLQREFSGRPDDPDSSSLNALARALRDSHLEIAMFSKVSIAVRGQRRLLGLAVMGIFAITSHAAFIVPSAPITPGGPAVGVPLTSAAAGTLRASLVSPFSFSTTAGTTSGTLVSAVYLNASGTLDFYDQVVNSAGSATSLSRESNTSFTGFQTQVAFRLDGGSLPGGGFTNGTAGIIPVTADRDSSGSTVGFNFVPAPPGTKIPPATTSAVLVISTDAVAFTAGNAEVLDGGAQTVPAFQPIALTLLSVVRTHTGTFAQGGTGEWDVTVSSAGSSTTSGTVTVSDTLPTGYTVNNFSTTDASWSCGGAGTQTATCTARRR